MLDLASLSFAGNSMLVQQLAGARQGGVLQAASRLRGPPISCGGICIYAKGTPLPRECDIK